jgi:hypothetical protein
MFADGVDRIEICSQVFLPFEGPNSNIVFPYNFLDINDSNDFEELEALLSTNVGQDYEVGDMFYQAIYSINFTKS